MSAIEYINDLIEREGGYVYDPRDSGGETKYGIPWPRPAPMATPAPCASCPATPHRPSTCAATG